MELNGWGWSAWLLIGMALAIIDYIISSRRPNTHNEPSYSFWIIFFWPLFIIGIAVIILLGVLDRRTPTPTVVLHKTDDKLARWEWLSIQESKDTWRWKERRVDGLHRFIPSVWERG